MVVKDDAGTRLPAVGVAQLPSVTAGAYQTAAVNSWKLSGEDAAWYELPEAPTQIAVSPEVHILPVQAPAPVVITEFAKPAEQKTSQGVLTALADIPKDLIKTATFALDAKYQPSKTVVQSASVGADGVVTFTAGTAEGTEIIPVIAKIPNFEDITIQIRLTLTDRLWWIWG